MATEAQINANRANAEHSTGPRTEAGKAASCQNNFRWGFAGSFQVLPTESQEEFDTLHSGLRAEHRPGTFTERILVEKMVQHLWLSRRAQDYQDGIILHAETMPPEEATRRFTLLLRYQTANDRAFSKCLSDLLKLRAERRKAEIGFERKERELSRERERAETHQRRERERADRHKMALLLSDAKLHHQYLMNKHLEAAQNQEPQQPEALRAA